MKEVCIALGVVLALALGALIGYVAAVDQLHKEAVANNAGHYEIVTQNSTQFVWN